MDKINASPVYRYGDGAERPNFGGKLFCFACQYGECDVMGTSETREAITCNVMPRSDTVRGIMDVAIREKVVFSGVTRHGYPLDGGPHCTHTAAAGNRPYKLHLTLCKH
jgi:hypothetical protein